jgi:hypothetical protein
MASALLTFPLLGMTAPAFAAAPPAGGDSVTVISNPATIAGTTEVASPTLSSVSETSNSAMPEWFWQSDKIQDVQVAGYAPGYALDPSVTGKGPGTVSLSHTWTENNFWSASVSVSAGLVSAALGFQVGGSHSTTASYTVQVPAGQTDTITAYPEYTIYSFAVFAPDSFSSGYKWVGSGLAYRFTGVQFTVSTRS